MNWYDINTREQKDRVVTESVAELEHLADTVRSVTLLKNLPISKTQSPAYFRWGIFAFDELYLHPRNGLTEKIEKFRFFLPSTGHYHVDHDHYSWIVEKYQLMPQKIRAVTASIRSPPPAQI